MTAILGKDMQGNKITIEKRDRAEGLYIIGSSGTGKSTLLTSLIQQDIKDNTGLCLLDPHGDLIQRTIELMPPDRYEDVILLDISNPTYAFGVNLFACNEINDMEEVENTISQVMHLLDKVYSISSLTPMMNQYFLNLTQTLLYNQPSSFLDIPRLLGDLPQDKKYRAKLAANVPNIQTKRFWASFAENRHHWRTIESISAIENKLDDFFRPVLKTIFGQEITTINMREIMDDPAGKIVLVKMNARWESITKLVGSVIVGQILDAAYSRSDIPIKKRRHFSLYADEFQWFASQDFATLFSEARKYGIGLTIAHQTLEQVDPHIIATCKQAKSIVSFRVSGENAQSLASQFDSTPPEPAMEEVGRRKKQTPVIDVVGRLLKNGNHKDKRVTDFTHETLTKLEHGGDWGGVKKAFNQLFHAAMKQEIYTEKNISSVLRNLTILHKLTVFSSGLPDIPETAFSSFWKTGNIDYILPSIQKSLEEHALSQITCELQQLEAYLNNKQSDIASEEFEASLTARTRTYEVSHPENKTTDRLLKPQYITPILLEIPPHHLATRFPGQPMLTWYSIRIDKIVWVETHEKYKDAPIPKWKIQSGQEEKFYNPQDLTRTVSAIIEEEQPSFLELVHKLQGILEALAETPILADSGEEEVIYRPGLQRTYADRQGEIANILTRLPSMHAYVRVAGEEHAIEITHTQPDNIKRAPIASVIKTITESNEEDEYIRKRSEVEAEIEARQNDDGGSPPPPSGASPNEPSKKPDTGDVKQPPQNNPLPIPRKRKINP